MVRVLAGAWGAVRHPAFWLPLLLVLGFDFYAHGLPFKGRTILSDGWGYYLHLPAIFIYGDPHLAFLNRPDLPQDILQYRFADGQFQGLSIHGSGYLDKYTIGPAVLQLPFFLGALAVAHLGSAAVNGFEPTFQIANGLSSAFYLALGSSLLYRACRLRFSATASAIALACVILGTNLLHYVCVEGSFAHVYGFCLLAGVVYLTIDRTESAHPPSLPAFILFGALMGLAVMVRPTNAVYAPLFLVFAWGTPVRELIPRTACALLASAVAASPQLVYWYVTTGHPIYYSYPGEGFFFLSPELRNYLFSIRKGVFFWHPLYLLMLAAVVAGLRHRPLEAAATLLTVLTGLYVGASWGDYTFGHSFGSRQSIELLPALTVPFAGAVAALLRSRWKWAAASVGLLLIALNAVQMYGYEKSLLPHNDANRVSYAHFWAVTLRWPGLERMVPPAQ